MKLRKTSDTRRIGGLESSRLAASVEECDTSRIGGLES